MNKSPFLFFCSHLHHCHDRKGLTKVITVHPKGEINFCTRFDGNPSNSWQDISLKNNKCKPDGGITGKVRGSLTSLGFLLWVLRISVANFMALHPIVGEIFQSEQKWWTVQIRPNDPLRCCSKKVQYFM